MEYKKFMVNCQSYEEVCKFVYVFSEQYENILLDEDEIIFVMKIEEFFRVFDYVYSNEWNFLDDVLVSFFEILLDSFVNEFLENIEEDVVDEYILEIEDCLFDFFVSDSEMDIDRDVIVMKLLVCFFINKVIIMYLDG